LTLLWLIRTSTAPWLKVPVLEQVLVLHLVVQLVLLVVLLAVWLVLP
jgi:hypothetical protein